MPPKQTAPAQNQVPPRPQPIIYQNNRPNFETASADRDFFQRIIEVDIGLHILIFITLLVIGAAAFFGSRAVKPGTSNPPVKTGQESTPDSTPKIAGPAAQPPVFINSQVISIDKAFNSAPTKLRLTVNGALKKEVFGYLPYWVVDKVDEIDTRLLTSVSYFGLEVGGDGEILKNGPQLSDSWLRWQDDPKLTAFIRKLKKSRIKVYLTFKSFSNDNIEKLTSSPKASQTFINNVLYQISAKALDGVNIDFEYVGTPSDTVRDNFTALMVNLNKELKRQYPKAVLTIATYARSAEENGFFDVELLSQNSDGLVVMGYDFHTPDSTVAGAVAPMGGSGQNLLNMVNAYLEKVAPEKIILAVPYYGYDWPVSEKGANAPVSSGDVRILSYAEINDSARLISINWDDVTQTPWYNYFDTQTKQNRVVHFENTRSLGVKYDFVNKKNLQGVGIWALGLDGRNTDLEQLLSDKFAQ